MKANEAPEKLYITLSELTEDGRTFVLDHHIDYPICTEYVRTDAFIEKATKWIKLSLKYYSEGGKLISTDKMIEDFKHYMKEDKL